MPTFPRKHPFLLGVLALLVGLIIGAGGMYFFAPAPALYGSLTLDSDSGYSLIDPILACNIGPQEAFPELDPIKSSITNLINTQLASGSATQESVYVRLLKSGKWFEINGTDTYAPASLLKVFVMLAYYRENEDTPGVLDRQVAFEGSANPTLDDPGEVIPHFTSGKLYSIRDIITQMIIYSDNDALNTLVDNFDQETLNEFNTIFVDLNIPSPAKVSESTFNFMTVSEYSLVFRVLFGATYLTRDDSEQVLNLLAQVQYQDGIVAGVPDAITVAHKFGVTTVPATATTTAQNELHDCGIVYYPGHPYLLCVMTSGPTFSSIQSNIQAISKLTYTQIDAYYVAHPSSAATATAVR